MTKFHSAFGTLHFEKSSNIQKFGKIEEKPCTSLFKATQFSSTYPTPHFIGRVASAKKMNMKRHLSGVIQDLFRHYFFHIGKKTSSLFGDVS